MLKPSRENASLRFWSCSLFGVDSPPRSCSNKTHTVFASQSPRLFTNVSEFVPWAAFSQRLEPRCRWFYSPRYLVFLHSDPISWYHVVGIFFSFSRVFWHFSWNTTHPSRPSSSWAPSSFVVRARKTCKIPRNSVEPVWPNSRMNCPMKSSILTSHCTSPSCSNCLLFWIIHATVWNYLLAGKSYFRLLCYPGLTACLFGWF